MAMVSPKDALMSLAGDAVAGLVDHAQEVSLVYVALMCELMLLEEAAGQAPHRFDWVEGRAIGRHTERLEVFLYCL